MTLTEYSNQVRKVIAQETRGIITTNEAEQKLLELTYTLLGDLAGTLLNPEDED